MYNLNTIKEGWVTKENILKHVNEYDIYAYYIGPFNINTPMYSPLREDNNPSFSLFIASDKTLVFNDFKTGGGNCIKFVMLMEGCDYFSALNILNTRYNLGYRPVKTSNLVSKYTHAPKITNTKISPKKEVWISIKVRDWLQHDKEYWYGQYEITGNTLSYFNVYPISKFWLNSYGINANKYAYAYRFDTNVYKIYQPYLTVKEGKWYSNIKNSELYQGADQLPEEGKILFITSSLKDVMVLYEAGYSAIAPHTEHQILSEGLFSHYNQKWDLVTVLYDNDEAGMLHANKMVKKYGIKSLILPESDTKDPSDFVKKYDLETLKQWIKENV
jgi:hypothetical protein